MRRLPGSVGSTWAVSVQGERLRSPGSRRSNTTCSGTSWRTRTMRRRLDRANGPIRPRSSTDQAGPSSPGRASVGMAATTMSSQSA